MRTRKQITLLSVLLLLLTTTILIKKKENSEDPTSTPTSQYEKKILSPNSTKTLKPNAHAITEKKLFSTQKKINLDNSSPIHSETLKTHDENRQKVVDEWDKINTPPEPNDLNYDDIIANAPFLEEIYLKNSEDKCLKNCADVMMEEVFASEDFAEQVNPDALREQAIREGLIDPSELSYIPLREDSGKTPPPLKTGDFIIPEDE